MVNEFGLVSHELRVNKGGNGERKMRGNENFLYLPEKRGLSDTPLADPQGACPRVKLRQDSAALVLPPEE